MADLFQGVEEYLAKQGAQVPVPGQRQEKQIQAEAKETIEEAYARRFRDLGW